MSVQLQTQYPRIVDVSTDPKSGQTYLKMFMLDDRTNQNFWQVPTQVMKKHATSFIGRPWIIHPSGDHPQYIKEGVVHDSKTFIEDVLHVQDRYKAGEIIDVTYEPMKENPEKSAWFATIKVTNPDVMDRLKSGAISPYVSPQIYDLSKANPGEPTTHFIPLHIATVNAPAYGNVARIKAACNGSGPTCINALKSAAVQLVDMINAGIQTPQQKDNSSFFENSTNYSNRMPNNNTNFNPEQQVIANNGYNPYQSQMVTTAGSGVDANGQLISQRTQTQELDANGNVIIRTEDKKPSPNRGQQQPQAQQQQQQQPQIIANTQAPQQSQAQPPQATQIPQNQSAVAEPQQPIASPHVPNELLDAIKGLQANFQGVSDRLNNIENFKKSAEDEKIKKASEAQRQIIESVFTPEIIQDEQAREDVINYFVGLPLADEDLQKILDMIVTGTFSSATAGAAADTQQASKPSGLQKKRTTATSTNGNMKQASINRLVMQNVVTDNYRRGVSPVPLSQRFFADINADNL